ncbi:hypothetical protein [Nocardioides halotolerans]|uniref:hypothetical protein n=1 Tax=Nocardioides halotolerans TaxID=433660 RepID=UPI0003F60E9F|nr:hypothetical protein [Nocardioides halotolerans]
MAAQADTKSKTKKRAVKVAALTAALVVAGGAAFAWWTAGGSGTGSATTGTVTGITINQTSSAADLYPGGPSKALSGTFTNSNSGPVFVEQVTVSIAAGWSAQADSGKPACTAGDYVLVQPTATHAEVTTGSTWGGGSIALTNSSANQDNCKGVTVPLVYSSN